MTARQLTVGREGWRRPKLAPAGSRIAAIRWHEGADNLWVGVTGAPLELASDLRPWRLRDFHWAASGAGLILELGMAGREQRSLAYLDLRSGAVTRLTPDSAADARYAGQARGAKPSVLVAHRQSPGDGFDLQAVTPTGAVIAEWQGPGHPVQQWLTDGVDAVAVCESDGNQTWWHRRLAGSSWRLLAELPSDASSRPVGFGRRDADGGVEVYATSATTGDTVSLIRLAAAGAAPEWVCAVDGFDVTSILLAADRSGADLITSTDPECPQVALSAPAAADLARMRELVGPAVARIIDRNATYCLAEFCNPVGGPAYLTFRRNGEAVSGPLVKYAGLDGVRVQARRPFSYRARDGRRITGFLTWPDGPPPWPAVLLVHGGPGTRDRPGFDLTAQHLAAAGLCCIQVNYRGSSGFGLQHRDAGARQWSLAMQEDLVDALRSAPVVAVTDPRRIAAAGHGYGGYAALMLATQDEVPVSAVVAASAPTDLVGYVRNLLAVGGAAGRQAADLIGDPDLDSARLAAASPLHRAADVRVPVLLFHGRQDPRVPVDQATSLGEALRREGHDYDLTIYDDEGHNYVRPQNVADVQARAIQFLVRALSEHAAAATG